MTKRKNSYKNREEEAIDLAFLEDLELDEKNNAAIDRTFLEDALRWR